MKVGSYRFPYWCLTAMKSFFWKFMIVLIPCALAAWATAEATVKYYNGDSGGFKLGVDLVGGTILVYEIDLRKNQDTDAATKFDPVRDINVLAESLKRRIDPNDLYNITIRPAGGEGRIEIILPTGGTHRAKKADATWKGLLTSMQKEFLPNYKGELEVGRGKMLELADRIQSIQSESVWREKLFSDKDAWARLQKNALDYWAQIDLQIQGDPAKGIEPNEELKKRFDSIPPGNLTDFSKLVIETLEKTPYPTTKKTVQSWIKKQAWEETMTQIRLKWFGEKEWNNSTEFQVGDIVLDGTKAYRAKVKNKNEKPPAPAFWQPLTPEEVPYQQEMSRITPDSNEQLTTFVLTKGQVIGQASLSLLEPLVGKNIDRVFSDGPDAEEVRKFIEDRYGPPLSKITEAIDAHMKNTGLGKDLSVEEVQRIKDLVSKVGSLEFRILANSTDDAKAIEDIVKQINTGPKSELDDAQQQGVPPPVFREMLDGELKAKRYEIVTARNVRSKVTYSWVELGPQERRALNLDNAARSDSTRNTAWHYASTQRGKATTLPELAGSSERHLLQGALFYSRECKDRNLPEEERRAKQFEYFVLTRDPEFESTTSEVRTPKIDGSYLVSAYGQPGQDLRPAVHFTFNNRGGELFGNITRKNVSEGTGPEGTQKRRHLAIILDGLVMSAPTINSEIRQQGQISGNFTQKEVDALVNILRAGRLPATLKPQPVSESSIAATLGEDTIAAGVRAILLAYGAVLLFMVVYYRFAGIVASIALMANLLLMVGFMVAVQATFTLSGLAGIVLTLGMAVDANVLIYERLREERERGASLLQAIRNGYDRALPTIIDTHVSSIFVAIVLYVVGNDNLKGFAVSMIVGLIISLFTSLFVTRLFFDYWQSRGWLTKLTMFRLFAKPDWDFMSIRYIMFGITLGLAILGGALFIGRLPNDLNIDFVGGTAYGGKLNVGKKVDEMRKLVDEKRQNEILGDPNAPIVKVTQLDEDGRRFELTFPKGDNIPRTVTFSNIPEGNKSEREKNVAKRASRLPEPSVEMLYNTTKDEKIIAEMDEGKSRNFMIRTTEKEAELVQACLDQLLREGDQPLLQKVYARVEPFEKTETRIIFFQNEKEAEGAEKKATATASPSFVKSLLNRELRRALAIPDDKPLPVFEVNPEGNSDSDGKFGVMKISFPEFKNDDPRLPQVEVALKETVRAFSARPLPDRLENFDSALATETRFRAMWAVLASWAAILLYLWFRFGNWTFGLAAVICLIHDLFFTLGAIAACYFVHGTVFGDWLMLDDFKIDLPSVAALLTLVGYSVNDTIVVFDRIREVRGKNPDLTPKMLNDSVNQTLSRTILSSLTVWLVVVVLYWTGGPGVHLFAFVMVIGVIVGTYSSIYIAAPLLLMFGEGKHEDAAIPQGAKAPTPIPEGAFKA
jgi:SecD/SecF fusion protein